MNISTMRSIDRYVGVPLCWLSACINLLLHRRSEVPREIRTILVLKFFGMGSILLSSGFLSKLRCECPDAKIIFLTFGQNREMAELLPFNLDVRTIRTTSATRFLIDSVQAIRMLIASRIDMVFDLEFFSKFSTLLASLSSNVRIGYELPTFWRKHNLTHPIPLDKSMHVTKVFGRQLAALGIGPQQDMSIPKLSASSSERASVERKLRMRFPADEVICVNINSGQTSLERRWQASRFLEVIKILLDQNPLRIFAFIGSANEHTYVSDALGRSDEVSRRSINLAGELSLGELVALFEKSTLFLTNDSGPMHVAAAAGTPVVALFGPESPAFYGPVGNVEVVYRAIECSPCLNVYDAKQFICPFNARCMSEISVDAVVAATERVLHHSVRADVA